jgi:hypothetical protein
MPLNLKPILTSQTNNEKLDAINYNFDQIVANGGGPLGSQGATGVQGLDGITGSQGPQGSTGTQGRQGPQGQSATNYWKINTESGTDNDTLVPLHDAFKLNPPTVMFGVDDIDPLHDVVVETTATVFNRKTSAFQNNLELTDDEVTSADGNKIYFKLGKEGSTTVYEMGFGNTSSGDPNEWKMYSDTFQFSDGTSNFATLNSGGLQVNVPSKFNKPSHFSGQIKYTGGGSTPTNGKVLVSSDTAGNAVWKSVSEIGGVVPIGTIVPILTSIFTDANNFNDSVEDATPDAGTSLKINYGRGKSGTTYEGWYLCNGKTWIDGVSNATTVPNLSSFTYDIALDASTTSNQLAASMTTANNAIIGGVAIDFDATYTSPAYSTTDIINNTTETFVSASTGTSYDLTKLVYVIYLGEAGLYWQDSGSAVAAVTHNYFLAKYISSSNSSTSVNYTINNPEIQTYTVYTQPGVVTWDLTLIPKSGYQFTSTTNVAIYTSGAIGGNTPDASVGQTDAVLSGGNLVLSFSDSAMAAGNSYVMLVGDAVATTTYTGVSMKRSTNGFNGNTSSAWSDVTVYTPGGDNLVTTTTLYSSSSGGAATAGWYAQNFFSALWAYRYWTGSSFSGPVLSGMTTAPGSWKSLTSFGFGAYKIGAAPFGSSNNICNSSVSISNKANGLWSTATEAVIDDQTTSSATIWVVGTNSGTGSAPVNFTSDSTYGANYFRNTDTIGLCTRAWSYNHSDGKITRQTFSCASFNNSVYDVYGYCSDDCTDGCYSGSGGGGYTSYGGS